MTSYQKLKKEVNQLSRLWKIAYEAMMHFTAQCKGQITEKDLIIINALNEAGKLMYYETNQKKN